MNKKSILERLQQKNTPKEREIIKVRVFRPMGVEILENLDDKDFDINDFRNNLSDRNYKPESNVNVTVFKKIQDMPNMVKSTIKSKTAEISQEAQALINLAKNAPKKKKKKELKPEDEIVFETVHLEDIKIKSDKGLSIKDRLPKEKDIYNVKPSFYVLNNREKFVNYINTLFDKQYRKQVMGQDKKSLSCDSLRSGYKGLLTHQQLIRDYMSIYSPYRGLLLYHGLGAGKTCGSIGIAEGLKTTKKVMILTPASLQNNYKKELKKCGDDLYRINQYWEFVKTNGETEIEEALSKALNISIKYIKKNNPPGAWLVNINKEPNYFKLSISDKASVNDQINAMIAQKYEFYNHNGMSKNLLAKLERDALDESGPLKRSNPFDNKVVVIDEVHNMVSTIVNQLESKEKTVKVKLYEYLKDAHNCRMIFLTGTPIINYPQEIAILYNMLRGYIKTYTFTLNTVKTNVSDKEKLKKRIAEKFKKSGFVDYFKFNKDTKELTLTRNPYGFFSTANKNGDYLGIRLNEQGKIDDDRFIKEVEKLLNRISISIVGTPKINKYTALPETKKDFESKFINKDTFQLKNNILFKRRILGLTSYFRSASEKLLPEFDEIQVVNIPMSDYQLSEYEKVRMRERKDDKGKNQRKSRAKRFNEVYKESGNYRTWSRLVCNYAFPPGVERPFPTLKSAETINENVMDNLMNKKIDKANNTLEDIDVEKQQKIQQDIDKLKESGYHNRLNEAWKSLESNKDFFSDNSLKNSSPKFLEMFKRIKDQRRRGLHLLYSNFRNMEGVGIFTLVLKAHGWKRLSIAKQDGIWKLNMTRDMFECTKEEDAESKIYALYTGTENDDEKEIIRAIYNGNLDLLPPDCGFLRKQLQDIYPNNFYGQLIKLLMITESGAEGIDLKNVRYVHMMEPYWHPVRNKQVVGRAVRICSHNDLQEKDKNVKAYLYITSFTDAQLDKENTKTAQISTETEISDADKSKVTGKPITTDQYLHEISTRKKNLNTEILNEIKSASIDCKLYSDKRTKEQVMCYNFGDPTSINFSSVPYYREEQKDSYFKRNQDRIERTFDATIEINGTQYQINYDNKENPDAGGSLFDVYTSLPKGFLLPDKPGSKILKRFKKRPTN
jgi:hypothetical protein